MSQFWRTISAKIGPLDLEPVNRLLTREQKALFDQLQTGEQAHAIRMLQRLLEQGDNQTDLLAAALLHDVGKLRYRLNPLERAMIVLVRAAKPEWAVRWGSLTGNGWDGLPGWRKAFIVAEQHAAWGAEAAHQAGVSPLAERLIREHHHATQPAASEVENNLLRKLWVVDNES